MKSFSLFLVIRGSAYYDTFINNPAQQVFLSFARIWRGSVRDEYLRTLTYTDPHPWVKFRANGAPFNVPEFYEAFPDIRPGNWLYRAPEERPVIW